MDRSHPDRSPRPMRRVLPGLLAFACALVATSATAWGATATGVAQGPAARWPPFAVGLAAGQSAMLQTTLGQGLTLSCTPLQVTALGPLRLAVGGEALWLRATEHSASWEVTQDDLRVRLVLDGMVARGRGAWLLRIGVGATAVVESRLRHQSERLLEGGIHDSGVALLPGAEAQFGVALRIVGHVGVRLRVGPALHLANGAPQLGVLGTLEGAWLP